jgi:hypothetical protein
MSNQQVKPYDLSRERQRLYLGVNKDSERRARLGPSRAAGSDSPLGGRRAAWNPIEGRVVVVLRTCGYPAVGLCSGYADIYGMACLELIDSTEAVMHRRGAAAASPTRWSLSKPITPAAVDYIPLRHIIGIELYDGEHRLESWPPAPEEDRGALNM